MMDGTAMYPEGFHPMAELTLPDISGPAPVLHRVDVPVKYHFIDFGISTRFAPDQASRLVTGTHGLDDEVPELSNTVPYDPFKTDVFIVGNLFKQHFMQVWARAPRGTTCPVLTTSRAQKYSNAGMLMPLVERMVSRVPERRPDAAEALREWKGMRRRVSAVRKYWRLRPREELWFQTPFYEFVAGVSLSSRNLLRARPSHLALCRSSPL